MSDLLKKLLGYVLKAGPLDGYKTALGVILYALTKLGFLPEINIADGISADEALVIYGAVHKLVKHVQSYFKKK